MPIFDQGYQHWKGKVAGYAWRWMAITREGLRGQLKGTLSIARLLLLVAMMPALLLVVAMALWGLLEQGSQTAISLLQPILPQGVAADPHVYRHAVWTIAYSTFFQVQLVLIMLLVVLIGPNLISRDLRFNALPLYFSRPIRRFDYFLGKLGVIAMLVGAVAVLPAIVAYILGVCFSLNLSVVRDTWRLLPASILYGLVIVVSAGTLMLALSSLSRRSIYVGIAWIGLWMVSSAVSTVLCDVNRHMLRNATWQEEMARIDQPQNTVPPDPDQPAVAGRQPNRGASGDKWQRANQRADQVLADAAKTDWRPLCSYKANLERIGAALLNTDAAWAEIGHAIEAPRAMVQPFLSGKSSPVNDRHLADHFVPQYPWIWSAGVLAGLFGLSLWILSTRVKSLDRLR
jgi:ABC-2 type transport system permease protein